MLVPLYRRVRQIVRVVRYPRYFSSGVTPQGLTASEIEEMEDMMRMSVSCPCLANTYLVLFNIFILLRLVPLITCLFVCF